jgi:hypothetical protein
MKIEMTGELVSIDVKRCRLPINITDVCPKCGTTVTKYLNYDYISFPKVNEPIKVSMYHHIEKTGEEHDWPVNIVLRVTAEEAL